MIADSHCHAWQMWPYDLKVPDPSVRGSIETLLLEMDNNSVERAAVVCARIGGGAGGTGFANEDNNEYVSNFARKYPDRLTAWIDVDSIWRPEHHTLNAAKRLRESVDRYGVQGFTHYVAAENDGWFKSDEGKEFFSAAAELKLVASLAVSPKWLEDLGAIAQANPSLPILIHHMGLPQNTGTGAAESDLNLIIDLAKQENIGVKISGFHYNNSNKFDYPYPEAQILFRSIFEAFGAERLFWGSDFPASRDYLSYKQSLDVVHESATFLMETELRRILGENLDKLLKKPYLSSGSFV